MHNNHKHYTKCCYKKQQHIKRTQTHQKQIEQTQLRTNKKQKTTNKQQYKTTTTHTNTHIYYFFTAWMTTTQRMNDCLAELSHRWQQRGAAIHEDDRPIQRALSGSPM